MVICRQSSAGKVAVVYLWCPLKVPNDCNVANAIESFLFLLNLSAQPHSCFLPQTKKGIGHRKDQSGISSAKGLLILLY